MNKNDVLKIMETIFSDSYFHNWAIRKSDNAIICKTEYGYKRIIFWYHNGYDLTRDDLALEVRPNYEIRFNVLHKWFEKYSKRTLKDQRDDYSVGFVGWMIGAKDEFCFLENRKEYEKDLRELYIEVVENSKLIFNKYSSLQDYYRYIVEETINGKSKWPDQGIEWAMGFLIGTKIVAPSDYQRVKEAVLQKIEMMKDRKEPNIMMYYDNLPMILEDLENTDFSSGKWGAIPPK